MKVCKHVLALALALILALTPVISPLHINAAEGVAATAVSQDITSGYTFENSAEAGCIESADNSATIGITTYAAAGVTAPNNSGQSAMQLKPNSGKSFNFRINFGKQLAAGSVISFDAYGKITGYSLYNSWEIKDQSGNTINSKQDNETWAAYSITLTEAASYIDLSWKYTSVSLSSTGILLVDNVKAVEPLVFTGDFKIGVGLEDAGDILQFVGQGNSASDVTAARVSYTETGVTAPANGGSYVLKLSHESNCWPTFRINFAQTLEAGTTFTFDFYGNYEYVAPEGVNKYMKLELSTDSKNFATSANPDQVVWTLTETWTTATVTLTADTDHLDFFYNVADGQQGESLASWLLLDNFLATPYQEPTEPEPTEPESTEPESTEPETTQPEPTEPEPDPVGNLWDGYGFEVEGNELWFKRIGGDNAWRDATFEVVSFDGDNALKLTCASSQWPVFRWEFGETLPAGTVITFDAYTRDITNPSQIGTTRFQTISDVQLAADYYYNRWNTLSIRLTSACDHLEVVCNEWLGNDSANSKNLEVYLDNFKATKIEPEGDILEGYGFEVYENMGYFTGVGNAGRDATIERVAYSDLSIGAPANGGRYALRMTNPSNY